MQGSAVHTDDYISMNSGCSSQEISCHDIQSSKCDISRRASFNDDSMSSNSSPCSRSSNVESRTIGDVLPKPTKSHNCENHTSKSAATVSSTTTQHDESSTSLIFNDQVSIAPSYGRVRLFRVLFLDVPLMMVLLMYAASLWIDHVHRKYLVPQLFALVFDDDRSEHEMTYFRRECTHEDMTTYNGSDLFLSFNATVDQAYKHHLKHGFTIFRGVLQPQTAINLRTFVDRRNRQLQEKEKIFVIEGDNRFSFGLGTEEPTVAAAMKEIASSQLLRPTMEKILGPDPALIEMTAITSAFGAKDQYWHDDVISTGSAINYGRTFGPSYSIFIQLQNTTAAMGATAACPGTHYCSEGNMSSFCTEYGFQLVDHTSSQWNIGDALLMNMNSYHRGAAHTDPTGMDRVMLILTFVPKPESRAESRQLSQGITFSLRWDMWGHTLHDLALADSVMKQPWATLRALGLYKLPSVRSWGLDYISSACMRMANDDNGFRPEDLQDWIKWGGFSLLPSWLEGSVDLKNGESWYEYLSRTHVLITRFLKKCAIVGMIVYVILFQLSNTKCRVVSMEIPRTRRTTMVITYVHRLIVSFISSLVRVVLMVATVYIAFKCAKIKIDSSDWAIDIKTERRYHSTTPYDKISFRDEYPSMSHNRSPSTSSKSTFPTRFDVLVETRYGSKQLAMYNEFINGHPGNELFQQLLKSHVDAYRFAPSALFRDAVVKYIIESVTANKGRFLLQNPEGIWLWMKTDDCVIYTQTELIKVMYPVLDDILKKIRFFKSDGKYGIYRNSALAQKHSNRYLRYIEARLLQSAGNRRKHTSDNATPMLPNITQASHTLAAHPLRHPLKQEFESSRLAIRSQIPSIQSHARHQLSQHNRIKRSLVDLGVGSDVFELMSGAWLSAGDMAEVFEEGYWYIGTIELVDALGYYYMHYPSGERNDADTYTIRPFIPIKKDEELEVMNMDDELFYDGIVIETKPNLQVYAPYLDEIIIVSRLDAVRRKGEQEKVKHENVNPYA